MLTSPDAEILALFLREYRDEYGKVPEKIQRYNRGVLLALNQTVPYGTLDDHQISKLKEPKVVYRCFMEQCAIDGTIDSQEWPERVYELLRDFELGERSKSEIKDAVKYEADFLGTDYFMEKYSTGNMIVSEADFIIDTDRTGINNYKDSGEQSCLNVGHKECSDREKYVSVEIAIGQEEMTDEYINSIVQIYSGETKVYSNKNIHIRAFINYEGNLEFNHCCIYYNELDSDDEITVDKGGKLSIVDSKVVCKGVDLKTFVTLKGENDIVINNTQFVDCSYFIRSDRESCSTFQMTNCRMENCFHKFVDVSVSKKCDISNNIITMNDLSVFYKEADMHKFDGFSDKSGSNVAELINFNENWDSTTSFVNNIVEEKENCAKIWNDEKIPVSGMRYVLGRKVEASNCTFSGMTKGIKVGNIKRSLFKNCREGVTVTNYGYSSNKVDPFVDNCVFKNCTNVVIVSDGTKISNCQFVSCHDSIIRPDFYGSGVCVELCQFLNIRNKADTRTEKEKRFDYLMSDYKEKTSNLCFFRSDDKYIKQKPNILKKCIFDGADLEEKFLIRGDINTKVGGSVLNIEDCSFRNCLSKRKDGKIIQEYGYYYTKFSSKKREMRTVSISICKGLDRVNKENAKADTVEIKTMTTLGEPIGARLS